MSEQSVQMYIQPKDKKFLFKKDDSFFKNINSFFSALGNEDLSLSKTYDCKNLLVSQWEYLERLYDFEYSNNSGVLDVSFSTSVYFDLDIFIKFLRRLGAKDIEVEVFSTQTGDTYYYKNNKYLQEYKESNWKWLVNNNPDFEGKFVVVTGSFKNYDRDEIECFVESFDGSVLQSFNQKTTLVVTGCKPDESIVDKAKVANVKIITAQEFLILVGEV